MGEPAVRNATPVMSALPEGVTLVGSRRLGLVWLVEALWERLGIGPTLRQRLTPSQDAARFERALLAMTANRLCDPQSKLGVWERLSRDGLPAGGRGARQERALRGDGCPAGASDAGRRGGVLPHRRPLQA